MIEELEENTVYRKKDCDKTFVTAPYYYLIMDKQNEVLYYPSIFSKIADLFASLSSWDG